MLERVRHLKVKIGIDVYVFVTRFCVRGVAEWFLMAWLAISNL